MTHPDVSLLKGEITISHNGCSDLLHLVCPSCECGDCYFECGGCHLLDADDRETEEQARERIKWNGFVDGITSLLLALSEAGHDISKMEDCVQTAVNAGQNHLF